MFLISRVFAVLWGHYYTVIHYGARGLNQQEIAMLKKLPGGEKMYFDEVAKLTKDYNPNPGYEPYWPLGSWVWQVDNPRGPTTRMQLVCGEECNYLFKNIRKVCGKRVGQFAMEGCNSNLFWSCDGWVTDTLTGFETFNTYCEFLNRKCHAAQKDDESQYYVFVHEGACMASETVFRPMKKEHELLNRARWHLQKLEESFQRAKLPSPQGFTTKPPPKPAKG